MIHKNISILALLLATTLVSVSAQAYKRSAKNTSVEIPVYKQATRPVDERVADLLSRMTLEEKIAQLCCPLGWQMYNKTSQKTVEPSQLFRDMMDMAPIGSFWAVLRIFFGVFITSDGRIASCASCAFFDLVLYSLATLGK